MLLIMGAVFAPCHALQTFWNIYPHPFWLVVDLPIDVWMVVICWPAALVDLPPLATLPLLPPIFLVFRRQAGLGTLPLPQDPTLTSPRTMHRQVTPVWEHDLSSRTCVAYFIGTIP